MTRPLATSTFLWLLLPGSACAAPVGGTLATAPTPAWTVVDTNQAACYDDRGTVIACPSEGQAFCGQDAQYAGAAPNYVDNGDGTVTDLVTGLVWQQTPFDKMSYADALAAADALTLGGETDWRVPTLTELYSLMDFTGETGMSEDDAVPYLDTTVFDFSYGDSSTERYIDAQYVSSTEYVWTTMHDDATVFGVNFADGRIKGYPIDDPRTGSPKLFFARFVRGTAYGITRLADNGDGTLTDNATGLVWTTEDSGAWAAGPYQDGGLDWQDALAFCEDLDHAGLTDWRLPDAKELQSIVDTTRSPDHHRHCGHRSALLHHGHHQRGWPARRPVLLDQHVAPRRAAARVVRGLHRLRARARVDGAPAGLRTARAPRRARRRGAALRPQGG